MNRRALCVVEPLGAIIAAFLLVVLVHDELGISRHSIVVNSLALAGILGLVCAVGAVRAKK